jgi:hypothetical protein
MRYRLMMSLFGLHLDKRAFKKDFGHSPERGLPLEFAGLHAMGAFDRNDADECTLSERGRYLLVAMMREFFVGVNDVRDQARAALPEQERNLLFGEGRGSGLSLPEGAAYRPDLYPDSAAAAMSGAMGWSQIGLMGDST